MRANWSEIEKAALVGCLVSDKYHRESTKKGYYHRDYDAIALFLNQTIHSGHQIRTADSTHSMANALRMDVPTYRPRTRQIRIRQ